MKNLILSAVITMSFGQQGYSQVVEVTNDSFFVKLKEYSSDFIYDMRYATENNFLKTAVYDCDECYLRLATVKALIEANEIAKKSDLKIKIFDCYRPLDVQKKMFLIVPNPTYVANPSKGSIHNRGGAVDLTLVDFNNIELDMGTDFDHFGPEAAHSYKKLSKQVLKNRKILRKVMEKAGFSSLPSEWWHYNLVGSKKNSLSNFKWPCP